MGGRICRGTRRPGYAGVLGGNRGTQHAGSRSHLRGPRLPGNRVGSRTQCGARSRDLDRRQSRQRPCHSHERRTDDCSIDGTAAQSQHSSHGMLTMPPDQAPFTPELARNIDAYWRAANYLSVGQIYLYDNPLLRQPLTREHIKPRLLGHWGTTPGLNFIYAHLNRIINAHDLSVIYIAGPGHGGPAMVANAY